MKLMAADYSDSILGGVGEKKQKKIIWTWPTSYFLKIKKEKKTLAKYFYSSVSSRPQYRV